MKKTNHYYPIRIKKSTSTQQISKNLSEILKGFKVKKQLSSHINSSRNEKISSETIAQKETKLPSKMDTNVINSSIKSKLKRSLSRFQRRVNERLSLKVNKDQNLTKIINEDESETGIEKWRLVLTETQKNGLVYGKQLKLGQKMRIRYMGYEWTKKQKLRKRYRNVKEIFQRETKVSGYGNKMKISNKQNL